MAIMGHELTMRVSFPVWALARQLHHIIVSIIGRLTQADIKSFASIQCVSVGKTRIPSYASMALRKAMDGGRSAAVRLLNYAKDGTPLWNQLSVLPLRCGKLRSLQITCDCGSVVRRMHCIIVFQELCADFNPTVGFEVHQGMDH